MATKSTRHAVEIVRDETLPPAGEVAAYSWQCDCGTSGEPFYATDLYGDEIAFGEANKRARLAAEIDSLDHTEYPHEAVRDETWPTANRAMDPNEIAWRGLCEAQYSIYIADYGNDGQEERRNTDEAEAQRDKLSAQLAASTGVPALTLRGHAMDAAYEYGQQPGVDGDPDVYRPPVWNQLLPSPLQSRDTTDLAAARTMNPDDPINRTVHEAVRDEDEWELSL